MLTKLLFCLELKKQKCRTAKSNSPRSVVNDASASSLTWRLRQTEFGGQEILDASALLCQAREAHLKKMHGLAWPFSTSDCGFSFRNLLELDLLQSRASWQNVGAKLKKPIKTLFLQDIL